MGIEAVFSDEPQVFPHCDGTVSKYKEDPDVHRLNCMSGLGTVTHVTAVFGMVAAGRVLEHLAARTGGSLTLIFSGASRLWEVFR